MENIALNYVKLGGAIQLVLALSFVAAGAALYVNSQRPDRRLSKVPYLVLLAAITLALVVSKFAWVDSHLAIADKTLWTSMLVQFAAFFAAGFALAFIGISRALDAGGPRWWAVFSFIPILNIGYGFIPSTEPVKQIEKSYFDALRGPIGVGTASLLAIMTFTANQQLGDAAERGNAEVRTSPDSQSAMVQSIIALRGLDFAVASLVSGSQDALPARVDETTLLIGMTANAETMTSSFLVEDEMEPFTDVEVGNLQTHTCENSVLRVLIDEGASIVEIYK